MEAQDIFTVQRVETKPIQGQNTGTSGLRKRVTVFKHEPFLNNWIQSLFNTLDDLGQLKGATIVVGGDGRYWNDEAQQVIVRMAAANGVAKLLLGVNGIISTPAISAIIRNRKITGGIILTASHNPGGPDADFGIKYNTGNGGPAPEKVTDSILKHTLAITHYNIADLPAISLAVAGKRYQWGDKFSVEIIDGVEEYLDLLSRNVFDLLAIKSFLTVQRERFGIRLDAMHGVTGPYLKRIFHEELGLSEESLLRADPLPDFGGGHPDPNLTYAKALVEELSTGKYQFGGAFDGDGDRNMILGSKFFVNPSDSLAIIADHAQEVIPYFRDGLNAVARSMPTGAALDKVAEAKGLTLYEVPTGWKFFGNIMDHYGRNVICGEESFGTGSDHIREKDGIWAVLAWLSILAHHNKDVSVDQPLVGVEDVAKAHWKKYGRHFFSRYDYEEVSSEGALQMMSNIKALQDAVTSEMCADACAVLELPGVYELALVDDFQYRDTFDGSITLKQGYRFVYKDGSRIIFRLSGTGSAGATIRVYFEKYTQDADQLFADTQTALKDLVALALHFSNLEHFTGRNQPTVIT